MHSQNPIQFLEGSASKAHFDDKSHWTRTNRARQAIDTGLGTIIGILDQLCVLCDSRTLVHIRQTHAQTLNRLLGFLSLNTGHIPARHVLVLGICEVELTPSRAIPTELILGDGVSRCCCKCTLRVLVKRNVDDLVCMQGEVQRRVAVPTCHGTIRPDLVPEHNCPGLGVFGFGAVYLHNIFVRGGRGTVFNRDDVAAPGVTNIAFIADTLTAGVCSVAKAVETELAVFGNLVPGGWFARVWRWTGTGTMARARVRTRTRTRTTWMPRMSTVIMRRAWRADVQTNGCIQRAYIDGSADVDETAFIVVANVLDEMIRGSMSVTTMVALKTAEG